MKQDAPLSSPGGPLAGLTVVDLTRALAGPHAGMILGDLGARVIKVEQPGSGDDTRLWGPPFVGPEGEQESTYFLSANRNKESVALDLKNKADREVLESLIRGSDVLLENFRPGTMDRLGFGNEALLALNPRLVVLSISGFGHDGPEGARAGYDQIAQGEAGIMSLTGPDAGNPQRVGVPIGDLLAGIYGVVGVLAALLERDRTQTGSVVRTSLLAALVGVHAFEGTRWTVAHQVGAAAGNHHPSLAPYGLFRCADGPVQLSVGSVNLWNAFATHFGLPKDDERFVSNAARVQNRAVLIQLIEERFRDLPAETVLAELTAIGVPSGRVRSIDEVYEWDQTRSQGLIVGVDHALLGEIELPGPTIRFFGADGTETTKTAHSAPPLLDQHGPAIRDEVARRDA
jgi:crotonobetainyl-CoA:carnitine CoA-transferase CaiB-like acyl-CoA transferase